MIFTGDIALPFFSIKLPDLLPQSRMWVGNLEGSVANGECGYKGGKGVYNDYGAVRELLQHIPFKAFCLANNHLTDFCDVNDSITRLHRLGVPSIGAGNIEDASKAVLVVDNDHVAYRILAFGWENIQCPHATEQKDGVNPLTKLHVLTTVSGALKHPEPVICFMHWDYELEKYPQPYDRHIAHELIDMGVSAVIGCHAHRVQPVEFYKGKPIVYGLGNFLFYQGYFFEGQLRFPKFCEEEYAFEITKEGYKLHYFKYDSQENRLDYVKSAEISEDKAFDGKAEFSGYTAKEYESFFKKNRVQKKLLPIFHTKESAMSYWMKSEWIKLRAWLLDTATRMNIKSAKRKDR